MAEWWIEQGIGETRAVLVERGEILEARILLDDIISVGTRLSARLIDIGVAGRNGVARDGHGREYLLPQTPRVTQGKPLVIEVIREVIPGAEPWKRPLARLTDQPPGAPAHLAGQRLSFPPPTGEDRLAHAGWDDVVEEALTGLVAFAGGKLRIATTPAMTLIDVDGTLAPVELAVAGATAAAKTIRRLGIGGSIGVDLPTVAGKAPRQTAAAAIDAHLPQPFERTAVNGFGFIQIVRPRVRASLLEIFNDRAPAAARALLRRAATAGHGRQRLVAHPAVVTVLQARPEWLQALARQLGGEVSLRADAALTMSASHVEQV